MPLAFTVYKIFFYSLIASLFLLIVLPLLTVTAKEEPVETFLWCLFTEIAIFCVTAWLNFRINNRNQGKENNDFGLSFVWSEFDPLQLLYAAGV